MATIFVLEDDKLFATTVEQWLVETGHAVQLFASPHAFFYAVRKQAPQCAVVDWRLPEMEGIDVVSRLRQLVGHGIGVLMLTGIDGEDNVVRALLAGADDYVVKPGSRAVLLARIEALLRRLAFDRKQLQEIQLGPYVLKMARRIACLVGQPLELTSREFELAAAFFAEPMRLFTKQELLASIWGKQAESGAHTVAQHVYSLRKKMRLVEHGFALSGVYGTGYRLEPPQV